MTSFIKEYDLVAFNNPNQPLVITSGTKKAHMIWNQQDKRVIVQLMHDGFKTSDTGVTGISYFIPPELGQLIPDFDNTTIAGINGAGVAFYPDISNLMLEPIFVNAYNVAGFDVFGVPFFDVQRFFGYTGGGHLPADGSFPTATTITYSFNMTLLLAHTKREI